MELDKIDDVKNTSGDENSNEDSDVNSDEEDKKPGTISRSNSYTNKEPINHGIINVYI